MGLVRRIVALPLVLTLSLIGIPLPAHAAEGESPPPRVLTFNGRPLSELLHGRATGAPWALPALLQQEDGQISGVALDAEGRPLAEHAVELKRIFTTNGGLRAAVISGTDTTNTAGGFSFTGLQVSDYVVEVLRDGEVVASAPSTLVAGAMQVTGLTVAELAEGPGMSRGAKIAIGIGAAAGGAILVMYLAVLACCTG